VDTAEREPQQEQAPQGKLLTADMLKKWQATALKVIKIPVE